MHSFCKASHALHECLADCLVPSKPSSPYLVKCTRSPALSWICPVMPGLFGQQQRRRLKCEQELLRAEKSAIQAPMWSLWQRCILAHEQRPAQKGHKSKNYGQANRPNMFGNVLSMFTAWSNLGGKREGK
eukprot:2761303-Amphidinium_carterae.2